MIGNDYDFLLEKYTDDPNTKLLSICIPAYKEDGYLQVTLKYLMGQRMFQNGYVQIVVGEYKDNYADNTTKNLCEILGHLFILPKAPNPVKCLSPKGHARTPCSKYTF